MDDFQAPRGDVASLSRDELDLLENKVLPTARRWLTIHGLAKHGRQTLEYWGAYDTPADS